MEQTAADILEKAAENYEAETIEWCQGDWVHPELTEASVAWLEDQDQATSNPQWSNLPEEPTKINACAAGAILVAAGFTWADILDHGPSFLFKFGNPEPQKAMTALEAHINSGRIIGILDGRPIPAHDSVPSWNDTKGRTKADVIEAMKATAKDLRNEEGSACA